MPKYKLYHGSENKFEHFVQKDWIAFDGKKIKAPVWLTPDKDFAKIHAGARGWIYTVEANLAKTFPDQDLMTWEESYYVPTNAGQKLIEDMLKRHMFGLKDDDWYEAEQVLKSIDKLDYDTLETKDFIDWLKENNYDSFFVRGDGPKNLAVLEAKNVKILFIKSVDEIAEADYLENKMDNVDILLNFLFEEISREDATRISQAKPNDLIRVYHGTPLFMLPKLINGFDATEEVSRVYKGGKHRGLFVTADFDLAKQFGGGAIIELLVRAKNIHGTDWDGEIKEKSTEQEKLKYPNSFRPSMSNTMLSSAEPQGLLVGIVSPKQINKIWIKNLETKNWDEYSRKDFMNSEMLYNIEHGQEKKFREAGIDLSNPNINLKDWLEAYAEANDYSPDEIDRLENYLTRWAQMDQHELDNKLKSMDIGGSVLGRLARKAILNQIKNLRQ